MSSGFVAPMVAAVDGPVSGPDRPILEGYLRWPRATLLNICAGLDATQLALRPIASSNLSLRGLFCHLARVERIWSRERVAGEDMPPMYDLTLGKDYDFDALDPNE